MWTSQIGLTRNGVNTDMRTTYSQVGFQQFIGAYATVYKNGGTNSDLAEMLGMSLNAIKCRKQLYKKIIPLPKLRVIHGNRFTKKNK